MAIKNSKLNRKNKIVDYKGGATKTNFTETVSYQTINLKSQLDHLNTPDHIEIME